jgi:hypothetical protein
MTASRTELDDPRRTTSIMLPTQPTFSDSSGTGSTPTAEKKQLSPESQSQPSALIVLGVLLGVAFAVTLLWCVCCRGRKRLRNSKRKKRGGRRPKLRTEVRIVGPAAARPRTPRERVRGHTSPVNYAISAPETADISMSGCGQSQNTSEWQAGMGRSVKPPARAYMYNAMNYLESDVHGSSYAGNSVELHQTPNGTQDEGGSVQTPLGRRAVTNLPLPGGSTLEHWGQSGYQPPGYETESTVSSSTN